MLLQLKKKKKIKVIYERFKSLRVVFYKLQLT